MLHSRAISPEHQRFVARFVPAKVKIYHIVKQ